MVGSGSPALKTEGLGRTVGEKALVSDVSVSLEHGDVVAVVGPSGSGKSTFLRLINRLDEPTTGTVYVNGTDYREIPPGDLRRRVGMVMQRPYLMSGTVAQNVCLGPAHHGVELSSGRVEEILDHVGLPGYSERDVDGLSGGESQRVSLARTLMNSPEILLLDEPTSALDEESKEQVEALILSLLRDPRLTCLFVTHEREQAFRVANRAMVMEKGRLVRVGAVEEILDA